MQNERHVHADLIIAWANGATIQYWDDFNKKWYDVGEQNPSWLTDTRYRIKPEPKSAGQVYCEVYNRGWDSLSQQGKDNYEHNAQRVIKAFKENNLV
jgi:hypothetical protein